jgi:uncharacterized protein (TIGR00290 family)
LKRALVFWSGGKDAAWSLHRTRSEYQIAALVSTFGESDSVVPIHEVPLSLISAQAQALAIPFWSIPLPQPCTNAAWVERMNEVWIRAKTDGIDTVVFGDLFLNDIREWRLSVMAPTGLKPIFPLWMEPTDALARQMIAEGLRARVCAVDNTKLSPAFRGRHFDKNLLSELPPSIDPCGENGEFHTFVTNMPGFSREVECAELFR